jgi:hypothetical protein
MTDVVCCPLGGGHDAPASVHVTTVVKAAKDHRCTECREMIPKGSKYENAKGLWDGHWSTFKTCLSCVEIRNHFTCESGWEYGSVWSQLEENFFPDMKAGGPCMAGLSPAAKDRLFTRRMQWLEDSQ